MVDRLVGGHEGDVLGFEAAGGGGDLGESYEVDDVDRVEAIVEVVSYLMDAVVANHHKIAHLFVVEMTHNVPDRDLAPVVPILAFNFLAFQVDLENVLVGVQDEEMSLAAEIESLLVSDIGSIETIVLPDFSEQH